MKKYIFLVAVLSLTINCLMAQDDELPPPTSRPRTDLPQEEPQDNSDFHAFTKPKKIDLSKYIIEPNFNFGVASNRIDVGVSPYVGYNVWKGLFIGGGITYFYTGVGDQYYDNLGNLIETDKGRYQTYGGGVFFQYNIWRGFFARAKFEVLHRDLKETYEYNNSLQPNNYDKISRTTPDLLLGVGYNMLQSKHFFFPIIISYNLLNGITDTKYSVYPNGFVIQLGFVNVF